MPISLWFKSVNDKNRLMNNIKGLKVLHNWLDLKFKSVLKSKCQKHFLI